MAQPDRLSDRKHEREQCRFVSPLNGERCRFFASGHKMHRIPDGPHEHGELLSSSEDDPSWDPEGVLAWESRRTEGQA